MRRFGILVVAAVLGTAGMASAQRARASANQPAKAAHAKAPAAKSSAKPAPRAFKATKPDRTTKTEKAETGIPAAALLTQYQRVGRELMLLASDRGAQIGVETEDAKTACAELQVTFRSIKLDAAVATPESRADTAELLHELHMKVERLRGVQLTLDCLNNPLAKDCT